MSLFFIGSHSIFVQMTKYTIDSGGYILEVEAVTEMVAIAIFLNSLPYDAELGLVIYVDDRTEYLTQDTLEYLGFTWEEPYEQTSLPAFGVINLN